MSGGESGAPRGYGPRHLRVEPVRHELELAVGRDEGDGPVVLEAREPDALDSGEWVSG